jgi:GTP-binding protein HflX
VLVGFGWTGRRGRPQGISDDPEESLDELAELAASAGAEVRGRVLQVREAADPATLVGAGKLKELRALVESAGADVVIFDPEITPTQQRNLEQALDVKVINRTQLILDIFASRARTREGRLQVELAQLNYLLPRLTGRGIAMSRLGGGIGTRGPGETQLETDRRRIGRRIRKLNQDLDAVRGSRLLHRRQRAAAPLPTLVTAGYTNAGKSTLFNSLTRAGVLSDARMFATLDPTVRALTLPSRRRVLLGDTVGFIRNLPTTLVKAFRATLEEVADAALILHVVDAASPRASAHVAHVLDVLGEIGAGQTPQVLVMNKIDLLPGVDAEGLRRGLLPGAEASRFVGAAAISAADGRGVDRLLEVIDQVLAFDPLVRTVFRLPAGDGATAHLLHECARVLRTRYAGENCEFEVEVPQSLRRRLARWEVAETTRPPVEEAVDNGPTAAF